MRKFDEQELSGGGAAWFGAASFADDEAEKAMQFAWKNRPSAVLCEIAIVLGATTAFVTLVNVALILLHIP